MLHGKRKIVSYHLQDVTHFSAVLPFCHKRRTREKRRGWVTRSRAAATRMMEEFDQQGLLTNECDNERKRSLQQQQAQRRAWRRVQQQPTTSATARDFRNSARTCLTPLTMFSFIPPLQVKLIVAGAVVQAVACLHESIFGTDDSCHIGFRGQGPPRPRSNAPLRRFLTVLVRLISGVPTKWHLSHLWYCTTKSAIWLNFTPSNTYTQDARR